MLFFLGFFTKKIIGCMKKKFSSYQRFLRAENQMLFFWDFHKKNNWLHEEKISKLSKIFTG
jgi:hypothetical protein